MKFKSTISSILIICLPLLSIQAQTQLSGAEDAPSYSLQECIDYAMAHNITLRQNQLSVEGGMVRLNQAKGDVMPSVNGQTSFNTNFGRNVDPFSNGIVTSAIGTNSFGVGANYTIYNGSRLKNTVNREELDLKATMLDVDAQENNISLIIAVSYLNILSSKDMIDVAIHNLNSTQLQLERTQRLVDAGSLPETDIFDLNAQLANNELQLVNAQNSKQSAILTLKQNMNLVTNAPFDVERIDLPNPGIQSYSASSDQVYQAAIDYLPEVKSSETRELVAEKNIEIARSVGIPSVVANANWGTSYSTAAKNSIEGLPTYQSVPVSAEIDGETIPFILNFPQQSVSYENIPYFKQFGNNQNFSLGISLQIPIFNGHNKRYQVQAAQIQQLQSKLNTENTKVTIRQNIDQAYIDMLNAAKSYSANSVQVDALEKAYAAAEIKYNAGASNFVDYNLAKSSMDRALANQIQAKYDYIFKIKILDFYQNKPLEF